MQQVMESLKNPELREQLRAEQELDDLEQKVFDLAKRVEALRPKHNPKLTQAVKIGILRQQFDSRKRRTP